MKGGKFVSSAGEAQLHPAPPMRAAGSVPAFAHSSTNDVMMGQLPLQPCWLTGRTSRGWFSVRRRLCQKAPLSPRADWRISPVREPQITGRSIDQEPARNCRQLHQVARLRRAESRERCFTVRAARRNAVKCAFPAGVDCVVLAPLQHAPSHRPG
jgi:hypothetical protein